MSPPSPVGMPSAFYEPIGGNRFHSTTATGGPWDAGLQHAGPPSALLGRVLERCEARPGTRVVRITVDILRPVPVDTLTVRASVARPGRSVQLVEGVIEADGREVMRAAAWRFATSTGTSTGTPETDHGDPPPLPPEQAPPEWPGAYTDGYMSAIEWRFVTGEFRAPGASQAWTRLRLPLVSDEETSPLSQVLTVADSGSGISSELDPATWTFLNTDLTVSFHRESLGEWVCLDSRTTLAPDGIGVTETLLSDTRGPLGRGLQSLLIRSR